MSSFPLDPTMNTGLGQTAQAPSAPEQPVNSAPAQPAPLPNVPGYEALPVTHPGESIAIKSAKANNLVDVASNLQNRQLVEFERTHTYEALTKTIELESARYEQLSTRISELFNQMTQPPPVPAQPQPDQAELIAGGIGMLFGAPAAQVGNAVQGMAAQRSAQDYARQQMLYEHQMGIAGQEAAMLGGMARQSLDNLGRLPAELSDAEAAHYRTQATMLANQDRNDLGWARLNRDIDKDKWSKEVAFARVSDMSRRTGIYEQAVVNDAANDMSQALMAMLNFQMAQTKQDAQYWQGQAEFRLQAAAARGKAAKEASKYAAEGRAARERVTAVQSAISSLEAELRGLSGPYKSQSRLDQIKEEEQRVARRKSIDAELKKLREELRQVQEKATRSDQLEAAAKAEAAAIAQEFDAALREFGNANPQPGGFGGSLAPTQPSMGAGFGIQPGAFQGGPPPDSATTSGSMNGPIGRGAPQAVPPGRPDLAPQGAQSQLQTVVSRFKAAKVGSDERKMILKDALASMIRAWVKKNPGSNDLDTGPLTRRIDEVFGAGTGKVALAEVKRAHPDWFK